MKRCFAVLGSLLKINSIMPEGPDDKQPEDALFNLNVVSPVLPAGAEAQPYLAIGQEKTDHAKFEI